MYVCICNGYRESELRDAAREGASTAEDAYLTLGDGPCCGRCLPLAQDIVESERRRHSGQAASTEKRDDRGAGLPALCPA